VIKVFAQITNQGLTFLSDGLTETELKKCIEELDLKDGQLDGKVDWKKYFTNCADCGRKILKSVLVCVYCGALWWRRIIKMTGVTHVDFLS